MKEQQLIKSFNDLGQALDDEKKREIQNTFERVLKDKFDKVSPGMFDSELSEIESIIITPVIPKDGRPSINATIQYLDKEGKPRSTVFSIFSDGVISGRVPRDLNVSREDLSLEILKTIERIDFDFWRQTDLDILPETDKVSRQEPAEEREEGSDVPLIRTERLRFLESQPRVICGFTNRRNGFKGYYGAVFPNFILLENPRYGNAAYIVNLEEPVKVEEDAFEKSPSSRIDKKTYEEILDSTWKPISEKVKSRGELRQEFGAQKINHSPDTWKKRLQEAIDSRLGAIKN